MAEERRSRQRIREFSGLDPSTAPSRPERTPPGQGLRSQRARDNLSDLAQGVEDRNIEPRRPREILTGRSPQEDIDETARRRRILSLSRGVSAPSDGPDAGNMQNQASMQEASSVAPIPVRSTRPQGRRRTAPVEGTTAEDLNEISLRLARGAAPTTPTEQRLARAMGLNFKKGGLVDSKKPTPFAKGKAPPMVGPPNMFKKKGK